MTRRRYACSKCGQRVLPRDIPTHYRECVKRPPSATKGTT